mmetsp:Transcript_4592/g.15056  ORF Transcript_4592/g.15056 Transcript_4592/m.15056 type:complete len:307 (-) Transcript_4592:856-1776(-)
MAAVRRNGSEARGGRGGTPPSDQRLFMAGPPGDKPPYLWPPVGEDREGLRRDGRLALWWRLRPPRALRGPRRKKVREGGARRGRCGRRVWRLEGVDEDLVQVAAVLCRLGSEARGGRAGLREDRERLGSEGGLVGRQKIGEGDTGGGRGGRDVRHLEGVGHDSAQVPLLLHRAGLPLHGGGGIGAAGGWPDATGQWRHYAIQAPFLPCAHGLHLPPPPVIRDRGSPLPAAVASPRESVGLALAGRLVPFPPPLLLPPRLLLAHPRLPRPDTITRRVTITRRGTLCRRRARRLRRSPARHAKRLHEV